MVTVDSAVGQWMPLYVGDWLVETMTMNNRQRGALMQLLCHAWLRGAVLPDDDRTLAEYAGESVRWLRGRQGAAVLAWFPVDTDGMRRNAKYGRLYAEAVARREAFVRRAELGAKKRWGGRDA